MWDRMFLRNVWVCVTRLDDVTPQETVAFFHTSVRTSNITGFVPINLSTHTGMITHGHDRHNTTILSVIRKHVNYMFRPILYSATIRLDTFIGENCTIYIYLPPTISIFSLPALQDLFLLPLSVLVYAFCLFCMGVKLGRWHCGRKRSWGCLRTWCWGEYLDLWWTR